MRAHSLCTFFQRSNSPATTPIIHCLTHEYAHRLFSTAPKQINTTGSVSLSHSTKEPFFPRIFKTLCALFGSHRVKNQSPSSKPSRAYPFLCFRVNNPKSQCESGLNRATSAPNGHRDFESCFAPASTTTQVSQPHGSASWPSPLIFLYVEPPIGSNVGASNSR